MSVQLSQLFGFVEPLRYAGQYSQPTLRKAKSCSLETAIIKSTMRICLQLFLSLFVVTASVHCLAQSASLDQRLEQSKQALLALQKDLTQAKSLADNNPSNLPLRYTHAQAIEKIERFLNQQADETQFPPFENAIRAVNSLTRGQLDSGPILIKGKAYEAALKLYDDSERMRLYWVVEQRKREALVDFAVRKTLAANALGIYQELATKEPKNTQWQASYISANIRTLGGQRQTVHENFQPWLDKTLNLLKDDPKNAHLQRTLAEIFAKKGILLAPSAGGDGYVEEWKREIDLQMALLNQDESNNLRRAELVSALERTAENFNVVGGKNRAFFALTDAKRITEELIEREPNNEDHLHRLIRIQRALAEVRQQFEHKRKAAQAAYLTEIERAMRAAKESPQDIEKALANAFKNQEETVELIYQNLIKRSNQLIEKQPSSIRVQRALVDSYMDLGKYYELINAPESQVIKLFADGAQRMSELAAQHPNDVSWQFYQLELNIALGYAYAAEIEDAARDSRSERLKPIPGYESKAAKDIRYIAKQGRELDGIENLPGHRRLAAASKAADAIYAKVLRLVERVLSTTPSAAVDPKGGSALPRRREF